jgi:hypothetical protein
MLGLLYLFVSLPRALGCAPGTYFDGETAKCKPCAPGRYAPFPGESFCMLCGVGQHQHLSGQKKCESGADNEHGKLFITLILGLHPKLIRLLIADCTPGRYALVADAKSYACTKCPKGKYREGYGPSCFSCPKGYTSMLGQTKCVLSKAPSREDCPAGQYFWGFWKSSAYCANCPHGKWSSGCKNCRADPNGSRCIQLKPCQSDFFCAGYHAKEPKCVECPEGKYSPGCHHCRPDPNATRCHSWQKDASKPTKKGPRITKHMMPVRRSKKHPVVVHSGA